MFTKLSLTDFKCFTTVDVPLRSLSLFCGVNSSGKSSAIHGLALLSQTIADSEWNQSIHLNGVNVSLGATEDVVNRATSTRIFSISLKTTETTAEWKAGDTERKDGLVAPINSVTMGSSEPRSWSRPKTTESADLIERPLFRLLPTDWHSHSEAASLGRMLCGITYLSAERIGPRETYPLFPKSDFCTVGSRGEFTSHYLDEFQFSAANNLLSADLPSKTVKKTVEHWMNRLFPGFSLDIQKLAGTGLVALRLQTAESKSMFRPQNVGFGLTYVLPVVTACVGSKPGQTVVIENPEAHLHPAGQSMMGLLLGITAASGVQVVVETHSDHVLNGIRKAVSRKILPPSDVVFDFFYSERTGDEVAHKVMELTCDEGGRISSWPAMFFDQMQNDLLELA